MLAIKLGLYIISMVFRFISVNEIGSDFLCFDRINLNEARTEVFW